MIEIESKNYSSVKRAAEIMLNKIDNLHIAESNLYWIEDNKTYKIILGTFKECRNYI